MNQEVIEQLPLPEFAKVRYRPWHLEDLDAGQGSSHNPHFAHDGQTGAEIAGQAVAFHHLSEELHEAGVIVTNIQSAREEYPDLVDQVLGKVVDPGRDRLTAANFDQFNTGLFVYIPAGVTVKPVLHLYLDHLAENGDMAAHNLVYVGRDSEATILQETHTVGEGTSKVSIVTEVLAARNAKLTYANLDALSEDTAAFMHRQSNLQDDARVDWVNAAFNDGNVIAGLTSKLIGEGAHTEAKVAAFTNRKQVQGFNTELINTGRHTIAHIFQRGVILNSSSLIFNGIGRIIKGAKGSDGQQESRVLMLSRRGRGEANPLLLIDENDVTAGHAASVGQVDDEQLYYLMSRGLTQQVARKLVIRGFIGEILAKIPDPQTRQDLVNQIERKLAHENV
ncbi:Fe-S cluster assembly protein SufD [Leuconostocaceae bacterium ESL0723]|nr:Fe-S cluster assembly protein SufD [Leuconostocaceae bacterium ESL0723]